MKNDCWEAIHVIVEKMEDFCKEIEKTNAVQEVTEDVKNVPPKAEEASRAAEKIDIVRFRSDVRTQLDFLRAKLAEYYKERDCYLIIFPIVVHFDELVQMKYFNYKYNKGNWPPIQKELFQIDNGGILLYETLDELLIKPQTPPFVFEVYYFCLNNGFRGKYIDNPVKIEEYKKKLRKKISPNKLENIQVLSEETSKIKEISSPAKYYILVVLTIALFYLLLYGYANSWKPYLALFE